ncbi:hypothetical protein BDN71DRAFT_1494498 [Pleurotus eryngii]|uniref:Uncharacterized protein n=1 Tax=Pleurotus eryngii TaxID=5323 RepID=A0A9P6A101_PLEER|nr:hypothetical protein BDN71DRAFT_1494498 [Pleurotus eryngii]
MAAANTSRDTLAHRQHEFDTVESKEVLCAAANIHWKGAPTSLHDPVFGALGLMGRMRALQYLGMFDLAEQFRVEEQDGVSDDDEGDVDARERVVESEDESDEPGAGNRTTLAEPHAVDDADKEEQEIEVVDDRFLPGEEHESKDGDGGIAHEVPTDPAKIPLPESDDDVLEEACGDDIDPVSATTKSTKSEPEPDDADADADADSGESDSNESDSGDELFWSSPINGTLELEEEDALEQDAGGANQDDESRNENDPWVTTNPRKRARAPGPGDGEDEPPCKMARVDEEELLNRFEGNVLKLAIHNAIQRNMASKLEANSYWHNILFDQTL